jgi:ubiquinone/menaquinone biosynthesis C-methylase UbiE
MEGFLSFFDEHRLNLILAHYRRLSKEDDCLKGSLILNAGGGVGKEASLIAGHLPQHLFVLDKDFVWLRKAAENLSAYANSSFLCADAERIPLKDKSVDIAVFKDILHHLVSAHDGLVEGLRVSKKAVFVDEPLSGPMRDLFNNLFVWLRLKERYEIRDGRELKFRIDKMFLERVRKSSNAKVHCFPYLFYHFKFLDKIKNGSLKAFLGGLFVVLGVILPLKNRIIVIILT